MKVFIIYLLIQIHIIVCFCAFVVRASLLTHGRLVVAHRSAAVVMFEQRAEHLGTHLRLPPERHVGSHHLIVGVQVVTGKQRRRKKDI